MAAKRNAGKPKPKVTHARDVRNISSFAEAEQLEVLLRQLRKARTDSEEKFSDVVVVRLPHEENVNNLEVQAASVVGLRNAPAVLARRGGKAAPRMNVLDQFDSSLVVKANSTALMAIRNSKPGLKMFPATWLYPQYIRPMGEELDAFAVHVAEGARTKRFEVRVTDADGKPLSKISVKALVDWSGAHVSVVSDKNGVAQFAIPVIYPKVELVIVEPEHTYWSVFISGFDRVAAPKRISIPLQPLIPYTFGLIQHYADYQEDAGIGVSVGVIDSGVGPHPALTVAGGACVVPGEAAADYFDNGIGHGTHVAGMIAARKLSDVEVYGVAPACRLFSYRVCPKTGNRARAQSFEISRAIERAIADQCDIVNISMGSLEAMPEIPDFLERARNAGMVIFAATGNDGEPLSRYPARYTHTLAVGALGRDDTFPPDSPESFNESSLRRGSEFVAEFSNHGRETDFIGPGVAVLSTFPKGLYAIMSGTSMATPFASGMAARLLSRRPDILGMARGADRTDAIIRMLFDATRKIGWSNDYEGFGVLR